MHACMYENELRRIRFKNYSQNILSKYYNEIWMKIRSKNHNSLSILFYFYFLLIFVCLIELIYYYHFKNASFFTSIANLWKYSKARQCISDKMHKSVIYPLCIVYLYILYIEVHESLMNNQYLYRTKYWHIPHVNWTIHYVC